MNSSRQSNKVACSAVILAAVFVALRAVVAGEEPPLQPPASARQILREASRIAALQPEHQDYWRERTMLLIGGAQIRAADFDGARQSIRESTYEYGHNGALIELAEALAAFGDHEGARRVIRELGQSHGWSQQLIEDGVRQKWIGYLISVKDFERARETTDQIQDREVLARALCQLAVGLFAGGDKARSEAFFRRSREAAGRINDDYAPVRTLCEIADAQMSLNEPELAAKTIQEAIESVPRLKPSWAKMWGLRESAVRAARNRNPALAIGLFSQAADLWATLDEKNRADALDSIAVAQANVGFIDDAIKTTKLIEHSDNDFTRDGRREEAVCQIAIAQAKAGKFEEAISTATSIAYYMQYQNDALREIARLQTENRKLDPALATTAKMENQSCKAAALLGIATAAANSGDAKKARSIAGSIKLKRGDPASFTKIAEFDFAKPITWGKLYDEEALFTTASHHFSVKRATEVASAAMTLEQALKDGHPQFDVAFNDLIDEEVVEALARAHAASGDARAAFAWASRIGSEKKILSEDDSDSRIAVQRRIHALVGVAEGMLDRSDRAKTGH